MSSAHSRRDFLAGTASLGGAWLSGLSSIAQAEPPPEVGKLRIARGPFICYAPQLLAEAFLRMEGFTDVVSYVERPGRTTADLVFSGEVDITMDAATEFVYTADGRSSALALAGVHAGCYELFGSDHVRAVRDLKGKTVSIYAYGGADHILLSSMLAYVGMNPRDDTFVAADRSMSALQLFVEGKSDAFLAFAPAPQELRARKIGRVIVNTTLDRPWSQYFCCVVVANRGFTLKHPVATKRALRAFLKAADLCAQEPERAARMLVEKGYESRYEVALEVLKELPYRRWRENHPEDTLRFHALRLHEVSMIKSTPQKLIAQATDWRFLHELGKELKA